MPTLSEQPQRAAPLSSFLRQIRRGAATYRIPSFAAATVVLAILCCSAWPFARTHVQAISVLRQVAGQPVPLAIAQATAVPVTTRDLTFATDTETGKQVVRARLYSPAGRRNAPAIIIFHGVHHLGIDEPRLMSFANSMASCGIQVLTPELPDIKDYHVGPSSVRTIGESAKWFAKQTGDLKAPQVGVMGLSFSGGLALVAAADPFYHSYFKFVFAVGSQDSMDRVTQYYRTNTDLRPDGTVERLAAHEYGPLVLEYEYLENFVPPQDLEPVRAVLRAHLYEDKKAEVDASHTLNQMQKRETLALMDAASPVTRSRIAAVLAKHRGDLDGVSPSGRLTHLATPVYLLHGEADNIIPSAETLWMADELPSKSLKAMLVSPVLSHIDLGSDPNAWDQWRLIHFFALVLDATERE